MNHSICQYEVRNEHLTGWLQRARSFCFL